MARRSQPESIFAEISEERGLTPGWRMLGDRLSRRLWLLQSEGLVRRGEATDQIGGFWRTADRTSALDSGE